MAMTENETDHEILGEPLAVALRRYKHLKKQGLSFEEIRYITDGEPREGFPNLLLRPDSSKSTNGVEATNAAAISG